MHPCCGGPAPLCTPKPDSGVCPQGTKERCESGEDGCETTCTADPPYCADVVPEDCVLREEGVEDRHADCYCP